MNNQEICCFVNSKDIRKHLLDINYNFTTAEASWLVYQCRSITLQEKIDAWRKIISTMPDQAVDAVHFPKPYESIHKVLEDYIEMKNKMVELFMQDSPGTFYQYLVAYSNHDNYDDSTAYSSFEKCFQELKSELKDSEDEEILRSSIRRSQIDVACPITAYYSQSGEITDIEVSRNDGAFDWRLMEFFDDLWFHFPVPYKKGDILYDAHSGQTLGAGPVVMTGITPLKYEEDGYEHTDSSDMNVWGYFQEEDDGTIYSEVTWNYMDFEYYPKEELKGKRRILKALSNYIKGEIEVDLLLRACHIILLEEARNDIMPRGWWTDEGMELAGIREDKNKGN